MSIIRTVCPTCGWTAYVQRYVKVEPDGSRKNMLIYRCIRQKLNPDKKTGFCKVIIREES